MAVVFRARRIDLGRAVALKVMRPETGYGDGIVERFRLESKAAAQLHHDNIVQMHAHGEVGDLLWIEMDLVDGNPLDAILQTGPMPWERAARFLSQAAGALAYAHARGVIHRDIKPANLLIPSATDRVMVTDFGVAKLRGEAGLTASGMSVGTPAYMSPEQCFLGGELTAATDQYSLGVVAYQMVTGTVPQSLDPGGQSLPSAVTPAAIRSLAQLCPPALTALIRGMLAFDAERRWPDLQQVSDAAHQIATTGTSTLCEPPRHRNRLVAALRRLIP
jgi:serine/threonine-protein kinase